ncbi:MAG: SBBP repeat-containing protein [Flavobacteriales bacterium]|nr:SBBP repeat-containing protein [Flavobacteriales bacterium]
MEHPVPQRCHHPGLRHRQQTDLPEPIRPSALLLLDHLLRWLRRAVPGGHRHPGRAPGRDHLAGTTYADDLYPQIFPGAYFDGTGSGGDPNGFLAKFDINSDLKHSTYLGNLGTQITDIALDDQGRLYVVGTAWGSAPAGHAAQQCLRAAVCRQRRWVHRGPGWGR